MIQILDGKTTIPSCVQYSRKENLVLIGKSAKKLITKDLENTLYDSKRLIGKKFSDERV